MVLHKITGPNGFFKWTVLGEPSMFRWNETRVVGMFQWRITAWLAAWVYTLQNPYGEATILPGVWIID